MAGQTTITPHNQQPFVKRIYPSEPQLDDIIAKASEAQKVWKDVPVEERIAIARRFTVRPLTFKKYSIANFTTYDARMSSER
jgi:acyl-CoA reductase-like NAD-dependent aldehyde dehydrogenase